MIGKDDAVHQKLLRGRKNENLSWDAGDCRRIIRFGL